MPISYRIRPATNSLPQGGTLWRGVGIQTIYTSRHYPGGPTDIRSQALRLVWDGDVEVDFQARSVDVKFDNAAFAEGGEGAEIPSTLQAHTLAGFPLVARAFEQINSGLGYVRGWFYGSRHEEAGGVFQISFHSIVGVFSAKRVAAE